METIPVPCIVEGASRPDLCSAPFHEAIESFNQVILVPQPLSNRVARYLWAVPICLLLLGLNQAKVAYDLRETLQNGEEAIAEVLEFRINERVDIPFGYVSLKVALADGREIVQEKMALPYTLLPQVRYKETLDVRVFPGASQQIVIEDIVSTQWKIATMQAMICLAAFLLAGVGVFAWNRYLAKHGDPAAQTVGLAGTN